MGAGLTGAARESGNGSGEATGQDRGGLVLRRHGVTLSGAGSTVLVFGHGFATDQRVWRHIRPWADRYFRTMAFDLAGCGPSGGGSHDEFRHATLDGYAEDLVDVLDAAGIDRCVYIGHDSGAMVGVLAALRAPERFERLVLLGPTPCPVRRHGWRAGLDAWEVCRLVAGIAADYPAWAMAFAAIAVGGPLAPAAAQEVAACLLAVRPDVAAQQAAVAFQTDLRGWIDEVPVAAAIIAVRNDPLVPLAACQYLAGLWPSTTLDELEGRSHLPQLTAPAPIIGILARRLSDLVRT
jgi:sigma-B regulation protein RsbQ